MGLYSLLRGIADRFRMAYLYPDQVIRVAKGIAEGAEISDEIKAKWRAESDRQVLGLMAQKERELKAQQAQQEYEAGLANGGVPGPRFSGPSAHLRRRHDTPRAEADPGGPDGPAEEPAELLGDSRRGF